MDVSDLEMLPWKDGYYDSPGYEPPPRGPELLVLVSDGNGTQDIRIAHLVREKGYVTRSGDIVPGTVTHWILLEGRELPKPPWGD